MTCDGQTEGGVAFETIDEIRPVGTALPRPATAAETFSRDTVTVLGLPFDILDLAGAVGAIRLAAFSNRRCFVSTPNLNFAMAALRDPAFRASVLHSELSLADGMPIVRMARRLGLPLAERVAGATVLEALVAHRGPPVDTYLFGGPPGVAARAAEVLSARPSGIRCVGHDEGGYGDIDSLGDARTIERINASGARFVVVSLGARKGQAWIERHRGQLAAPVVSHLGAALNFVAGTVKRAPPWMQSAGLEWAWRVREEPALWRRYADDGAMVMRLALERGLWRAGSGAPSDDGTAATLDLEGDGSRLRLAGAWTRGRLASLRDALVALDRSVRRARLDVAAVTAADASFVALLQLATGRWGPGSVNVERAGPAVERLFRVALADDWLAA